MKNKLQSFLFLALVMFAAWLPASSFAGYANLAAPSGWSGGTQAMYQGAKEMIVRGASNAPYFMTQPSIQVAGKAVTVPAALRFSANAGRFLAAQAFVNPTLFVAAVVGTAVYSYYNEQGFFVDGNIWKKRTYGEECTSGCFEYWSNYSPVHVTSNTVACNSAIAAMNATGGEYTRTLANASGTTCTITVNKSATGVFYATTWYDLYSKAIPPWSSSSTRPATRAEFESTMENAPIPAGAPEGWPMALPPLPVEVPRINPDPLPWAVPSPAQQPLRVPVGDPVPVSPATNPQTYKSPVIDIVPSPTANEPWRVDLQPKDVTSLDPSPLPYAAPVPQTPASGTTAAPTEFKTCGLPGTPACKIDETGTPEKKTDTEYNPKADALKAPKDAALERMKTPGDTSQLFNGWTTFFAAPALATCSPIVLPNFNGASMGSLDPCPVVSGMREVMGYLWAVGGLFLCLGMVRQTVQGG